MATRSMNNLQTCQPSTSARPSCRSNTAFKVVCNANNNSRHAVQSSVTETSVGASRRQALKAVVAGLAAVGASRPALAGSEGDNRQGEIRHTDAEWKQLLNEDQYAVLRTAATERRFSSPLVEEHRKGVFVCAGCDSPLYASDAKYESGTGWPSFFAPLPGAVEEVSDRSIPFMPRVEVRCKKCQGHLGHVFPDGPEPTGMRYCMNGLAMKFKPADA